MSESLNKHKHTIKNEIDARLSDFNSVIQKCNF